MPLEALARELDAATPARIDALLHAAVAAGHLAMDRRGFLLPVEHALLGMHGTPPVDVAMLPYQAKPLRINATERHVLSTIFGVLRDMALPEVPPCWLSDRYVVSPYLAGTVDLRQVYRPGCHTTARRVHDLCLMSLGRLMESEATIRAALQRAQLQPRAFPLATRYEHARFEVARVLGLAAADALCMEDCADLDRGPRSLFFDPKPANLLMPTWLCDNAAALPYWSTYRIDLDMLGWEAPILLQLVLIHFAFPLFYEIQGGEDDRFAHKVASVQHMAARLCGATRSASERMIWYHLLRNFASATAAQEWDKGVAMGRLILIAARQFECCAFGTAPCRGMEGWLSTITSLEGSTAASAI